MLLIKNAFLYDPASGTEGQTDLLIREGRFVLPGTEELNAPLEDMELPR